MKKKSKKKKKNTVSPLKTTNNNIMHENSSISVCMIVKDEEQFLDNCLTSVKDIADEIIIIDTGSKDKTVEIAQKYTDKIYFHPWKDSFSEARNHYFEYATGDWIFQIDADEELVKEDIPILLNAVKNPSIDVIMLQIISRLGRGQSESRHSLERVFRNNGLIHYEGRIHEGLIGFKSPMIYPVRLKHYGYDLNDEDLSEKKLERRIRLLKMDIEEYPDNPLPYHYLSCCYLSRDLLYETIDVSLKAIELAEKQKNKNSVFLWTRYNASIAYYKLKEFKNAESMALSAITLEKRHLDSYFLLMPLYLDQLKWHEVIKHGNEYLLLIKQIKKNPEEFGTIVFNSISKYWKVHIWMGIAYYETDNIKEAEQSFRTAVKYASDPFNALKTIGIYYYNKALFTQAREYLEKAFDVNKEDAAVNNLLTKIGTDDQDKQTISCCMIVKNEEQFLEKCLKSIKDYVDEIIIVDTGSTDSTVEIAKRFTDKVYFHPWENSFSKARNQALQYAKGDWIFQIDGDEELMAGSGPHIRMAVREAGDSDIIYVRIYSSYANGTKKSFHNFERLFRNNGKIHYEGSVHNQVIGGTSALNSSISLWHYGYDVDEKKALEKFERTTGLLKKEIEKDPLNPMHHHNLSISYFSRHMNEEAVSEALKAIELSNSQKNNNNLYAWSYFIASMGYFRMGRLEEARKYAEQSLNKYSEHMDSNFMLTIIAADECRWDDVIQYGRIFFELLESVEQKKGNVILENSMNEGPMINMLIGHAYYAKKSFREMERYYKKAYNIAEKKWAILLEIGAYHMSKSCDFNLAGDFLSRAVKEAPDEHDVWYMMAKLNNKRCLIKEEIECLEKVVKIGAKDNFVSIRLFSLYMQNGQYTNALNLIYFEGFSNSNLYPELIKLGNIFIKKGEMESGIQCYMKAVEIRPETPEAWNILGEVTLAMGRLEDSQVFLVKALQIDKKDTGIILALCELELKRGDIESHIKYCDMLLERLSLPRDRVIDSFNDLKSIFMEIESTLNDDNSHSKRILSIIAQLPLKNDSVTNESQANMVH
jgi:glycosyltransferase involved in cell wall biosynthesis